MNISNIVKMIVLIAIHLTILSLLSTYAQGSRLYNFNSHRCCDGQVHELTEEHNFGYDYICCGTELYKYQQDNGSAEFLPPTCCLDKLYSRMNRSERCCGAELYESSTSVCYQWGMGQWDEWGENEEYELLRLSDDDIRNNKTNACGKSRGKETFYDPKKQTCCSGILHERKNGMTCCGEDYIDTTIARCCYEVVNDDKTKLFSGKIVTSVIPYNDVIPKRSTCCNGSIIDAEIQVCCGGVAVDLPKQKEPDYYPLCCGTELLSDMKSQVCEGGDSIVDRGSRLLRVSCGEQLHDISGDEPFNVYCFNGTLLKLNESEHLCPVNEKHVISDSKKQVCGFNEVVDITQDDLDNNRTAYCWKTSESQMLMSKVVFPALLYRPLNNASQFYSYYF